MDDEWGFKLRLFDGDEYHEHWKDRLSKHVRDGSGQIVGAQWMSSFEGEPPETWDNNASYRPICIAPEDDETEAQG